jgi:hypothetical protein
MVKKKLIDADVLAVKIDMLANSFFIPSNTPSYYTGDAAHQASVALVSAIQTNINMQITNQVQMLLRNLASEIRMSSTTVNECMLCHKHDWEEEPPKV